MSREQLVSIAERNLAHRAAGTQDQAVGIAEIPTSNYVDRDRWSAEIDAVFRRLPLVVGASCELRDPHSYIAGEIAGTPYLVSRGSDGELRAFYNMCSHRGAVVVPEGTGTARRHSCPYHGWTYDDRGALVGVTDAGDVGELDRACLGLTPLACAERAGIVWLYLGEPVIDIDTFLCGYGEMLGHHRFEQCHAVGRQTIDGPNWKIAYDGYLDFYHLPILHKDSFGPQMSTKANYDAWGPHQRVTCPERGWEAIADRPEDEWQTADLIGGVWTIFPHVSIAGFDASDGSTVYMVSMLYPGDAPGSSTTTQLFLQNEAPGEGEQEEIEGRMKFNRHVVENEDYATGLRLQRALRSGGKQVSLFGRNEGGGQRFHSFLAELLDTDDVDLPAFFERASASRMECSEVGSRV